MYAYMKQFVVKFWLFKQQRTEMICYPNMNIYVKMGKSVITGFNQRLQDFTTMAGHEPEVSTLSLLWKE